MAGWKSDYSADGSDRTLQVVKILLGNTEITYPQDYAISPKNLIEILNVLKDRSSCEFLIT
jgi:hypothetical protein